MRKVLPTSVLSGRLPRSPYVCSVGLGFLVRCGKASSIKALGFGDSDLLFSRSGRLNEGKVRSWEVGWKLNPTTEECGSLFSTQVHGVSFTGFFAAKSELWVLRLRERSRDTSLCVAHWEGKPIVAVVAHTTTGMESYGCCCVVVALNWLNMRGSCSLVYT